MEPTRSASSDNRKRKMPTPSYPEPENVVGNSNSENFGDSNCNSCSRRFRRAELYRCQSETCAGATVQIKIEFGEELLFCQMCIVVLHLRQKHAILDHRGYKPAICEEHENLCQQFCQECRTVFCFESLGKHVGHFFCQFWRSRQKFERQFLTC